MNYLVDDIGYVVASMREYLELNSSLEEFDGLAPFYMYGHKLDISNRLLGKDNDKVYKYQKYPLIALLMDFPEQVDGGLAKYTLHVAIFHLTKSEYTIEQRYQDVFKPVLYPLYRLFINRLRTVGHFTWPGEQTYPPHTKIDRPFWGKVYEHGNEAYIFNDRLDCIEITDLKINKRVNTCL